MDGFGVTTPIDTNAVFVANTPFFDNLTQKYPTMLLNASGLNVGLPWGEVGNSEVGHVNLGSGTLLYQSLPKIDKSIDSKEFYKNYAFSNAIEKVKQYKSNLHIVGLLGTGGVHSHLRHLDALVELCRQNKMKDNVFYHLFLDGRDTEKDAGLEFMQRFLKSSKKIGEVASVCGRFFGLDRNNNWDRIQKAYNAICCGKAENFSKDPIDAIKESYKKGIYDENFEPVVIVQKKTVPLTTIKPEDAVIFFNYRGDRARQLTQAFVEPEFDKFPREFISGLKFITFTEYKKGLPVEVAFPPEIIKNPIAKVFSDNNLKQLHIAETEKYAHVTFFLNGQLEQKFAGEDRILIDSPAVVSYDQTPEMSAHKVCAEVEKALNAETYDFIVINFANPDMVGHTGNMQASVKAIETVDTCLSKIVPLIIDKKGAAFIVGDHGNAEEMVNFQTGLPDKEHSIYPVPFVMAADNLYGKFTANCAPQDLFTLSPSGILADVAPTILLNCGLPLAPEMTGANLLG